MGTSVRVCVYARYVFLYVSTYSMCVFASCWRVEKKGRKFKQEIRFCYSAKIREKKPTTEMNSPDDDNDPFRWHCTNKARSNPSPPAFHSRCRSFIFCLSCISRQFAAHVLLLVEAHSTDFIIKTNINTHRHIDTHSLSPNVNKQKGYRRMNEWMNVRRTHRRTEQASKQDTKQLITVVS